MTTIDHSILITAPQQIVWKYLSDISNNPNWQVDCKVISFLTTHHSGEGTRYRYRSERGREYVVELTAWYNLLGYEYVFVDGSPFASSKGRIRLHERPEGTVVQWSFTYELGGAFSGLRNVLGMKRSVDNMMVDSLWTLWRQVGQLAVNTPMTSSKSLMQDAPNVEARAQYKPRHDDSSTNIPSVSVEAPIEASSQPPQITDEPPVVDDDTRPRPITPAPMSSVTPSVTPSVMPSVMPSEVSPEPEKAEDSFIKEPDFLSRIREEESRTDIPPVRLDSPPPITVDDTSPNTVPSEEPVVAEPESIVETPVDVPEPVETIPPVSVEREVVAHDLPLLDDEPTMGTGDTSQVSVFDIFGIQKPSETQEMRAVELGKIEDATPDAIETAVDLKPVITPDVVESASDVMPETASSDASDKHEVLFVKRVGKRVLLRRSLVRLRRPR